MRLIALILFSFLSLAAFSDSWYGYCVVQNDNQRICSAPQPKIGDFSPVCWALAEQEGASGWQAQFSTDLDQLRLSMGDYCDVIRDDQASKAFACKVATLCADDAQPNVRHLASRVFAPNESEAITSCHQKEDWRYHRELLEQSKNGCFMNIAVELMP